MRLVSMGDPFAFMYLRKMELWEDINENHPALGDIIEFSDVESGKWTPTEGEWGEIVLSQYYDFLKFQSSLPDSEKQFGIPPFKIMYSMVMQEDGKIKVEELKDNRVITTIY